MHTKEDLTLKVDTLLAYAVQAGGLDPNKLETLLSGVYEAIEAYFAVDISPSVSSCIEATTHGLVRTGIKYADGTCGSEITGAPRGFYDIRELFDVGTELMRCSEEAFTRSVVEVTPTLEDGSSGEPYYESQLVNEWIIAMEMDAEQLLSGLQAVSSFGNSVALGNNIKLLLEPPEVVSVPSLVDIAKTIYIDYHYLELIELRELEIYVPSSVREV